MQIYDLRIFLKSYFLNLKSQELIPVLLTKIKTRDGVTLDGIYVKPNGRSKTALVWLHGLSSNFYSRQPRIKEISEMCRKTGLGYFNFNNRGHDIVNRNGSKKKALQGACFEKFEDCVFDISAVINFAKKLGYRKIILAGHSTGANKALYYAYKTKSKFIKGLILLGPISDIVAESKRVGAKKLERAIGLAKKLKTKNQFMLMPQRYGLWTIHRYLSLFNPEEKEDVFPYYNPKAGWKELRSVKIPLAIFIGSRDKHLDRPAKKLIEIFRQNAISAKSFSGIIIKGANHGFYGKEKELAQKTIKWIKRAIG